jgi:hypothetical protein
MSAYSSSLKILTNNTMHSTSTITFRTQPIHFPDYPGGEIYCNDKKIVDIAEKYDIINGTMLQCKAKANTGHAFSSWSLLNREIKNDTVTVTVSEDTLLTANFQPKNDASSVIMLLRDLSLRLFLSNISFFILSIGVGIFVIFIYYRNIYYRNKKKDK